MQKPTFVRKLTILELVEEMEIIEPMTLVNYLDMTEGAARKAIWRLQKVGYLEPLRSEGGGWILTNKGDAHLDFLRRCRDVKQ